MQCVKARGMRPFQILGVEEDNHFEQLVGIYLSMEINLRKRLKLLMKGLPTML